MEKSDLFMITVAFICGLCIFAERAFPFLLFSKKNPPKIIKFVQKYIPSMVMACLLVYCLKDVTFVKDGIIFWKGFVPHFAALGITFLLQIFKKNTLLSILSGTILYMVLLRVL